MKGKPGRIRPAPPMMAMAALLLTLGVVATTPLAWAKYVASATVNASARVAKWDIYFHTSPSEYSTAYLDSNYREGPKTYTFCIYSDSEVAANVQVEIRYETSDGTVLPAAVTKDSPLFMSVAGTTTTVSHGLTNLANNYPGGSPGSAGVVELSDCEFEYEPKSWVWFTIDAQATTPAPSGTTIDNCMRSYKVFFNARQID